MPGACYQFLEKGSCSYGNRCKFLHDVHGQKPNKGKGKRRNKRQKQNREFRSIRSSAQYIDEFFENYPAFDYDPHRPCAEEFFRMCDYFDWDREDEERQEAHENYKTALVKEFNALYGTDEESIGTWQGLCIALDISPLPDDVHEAKELFKGMFVNLVDLVDNARLGLPVSQLDSLEELQRYTKRTGKFFPKESAYAGGMLKFLLREILNAR